MSTDPRIAAILDEGDTDRVRYAVAQVTAAEHYAGTLAVFDPFNIGDSVAVSTAVERLVEHDPKAADQKARLDALLDRIMADKRYEDVGDDPSDLDDKIGCDRMAYGDAGYLLGLVVGMKLGPQYLKVFAELRGAK